MWLEKAKAAILGNHKMQVGSHDTRCGLEGREDGILIDFLDFTSCKYKFWRLLHHCVTSRY